MSDQRILLMTGPLRWEKEGINSIPDIRTIGDEISSFDLCGRSWADEPKTWSELLFSTFKPIFCHGRKTSDPIKELLEHVTWLHYQRPSFLRVTGTGAVNSGLNEIVWGEVSLLVVCSKDCLRDIIGHKITDIYSYHAKRDDERGEKGPFFLSELGISSGSLRSFLPSDMGKGIELAVLPEPSIGGRRDIKGFRLSMERFDELRQDHVRRVHNALGCERHALW